MEWRKNLLWWAVWKDISHLYDYIQFAISAGAKQRRRSIVQETTPEIYILHSTVGVKWNQTLKTEFELEPKYFKHGWKSSFIVPSPHICWARRWRQFFRSTRFEPWQTNIQQLRMLGHCTLLFRRPPLTFFFFKAAWNRTLNLSLNPGIVSPDGHHHSLCQRTTTCPNRWRRKEQSTTTDDKNQTAVKADIWFLSFCSTVTSLVLAVFSCSASVTHGPERCANHGEL